MFDIDSMPEFRSGNSVPVTRATISRERMQEAMEAYAASKAQEAQQWQAIETAPKDGTPLLLFARWERAEASIRVIGWFIGDEWISNSFIGQGKAVLVPSHWMPLPPFP